MHQGWNARDLTLRVIAPLLLGVGVGCAPTSPEGGCGSPPMASDASAPTLWLQANRPPCTTLKEAPLGSDPHLLVSFQCPGESKPFMVAVRIDGELVTLQQATCATWGSQVMIDAGLWEPSDSRWHDAEVILDPLNLFKETDETNNRSVTQLRVTDPDVRVDAAASGFVIPYDAGGDNFTLVSQVSYGTPVNVRLRMVYGGAYEAVVRSVSSDAVLDSSDTIQITCPDYGNRNDFVKRWLPPGPGAYDVEFRVQPQGTTPDANTSNNVVVKRLTVTAPGPLRSGRWGGRP